MDLQITSFNKGSEKITGISREEAIGKPCFKILKASMCDTNCLIKQTFKGKKPIVNMPVYIHRPDNKRFCCKKYFQDKEIVQA
ncbi:MAG: PAS domain-containing protein [Desulfobacter sp.]|nr:PAS domain-containing protein [Desulfobacter sp.]